MIRKDVIDNFFQFIDSIRTRDRTKLMSIFLRYIGYIYSV